MTTHLAGIVRDLCQERVPHRLLLAERIGEPIAGRTQFRDLRLRNGAGAAQSNQRINIQSLLQEPVGCRRWPREEQEESTAGCLQESDSLLQCCCQVDELREPGDGD